MIFSIGNVYTGVKFDSDDEREWLDDYLSDETVAFFPTKFGAKRKVVRTTMLESNGLAHKFPSGFARKCRREALNEGFEIEMRDLRVVPKHGTVIPKWLLKTLRIGYQDTAVEIMVKRQRGVIDLPPGSGKTRVGIATAITLDVPTLYICPDAQLVQQAAKTWKKLTGTEAGQIHGKRNDVGKMFVVTTPATLVKRLGDPKIAAALAGWFKCLIADEAHTLPADQFLKCAKACNAFFRYGMSASPFLRSDGKSSKLKALIGPMLFRKTYPEIVAMGYAPRAIFRMIKNRLVIGKDVKKWGTKYTSDIVKSPARNALIASIVDHAQKPVIVLFEREEHGPLILKALERLNINAALVGGKTPVPQRERVAEQLESGRLECVVASRVWNQGVDIPGVRTTINAGGQKSRIRSVQQPGRAARQAKGKDYFTHYDMKDEHPFPNTKGAWMHKHAALRLRAYRLAGHKVKVGETITGPWTTYGPIDPYKKSD